MPFVQPLLDALPTAIAPAFDGSKRLMARGAAQRFLLRRSFDSIAARANLTLLTDHVERAAAILANQLETAFVSARDYHLERIDR